MPDQITSAGLETKSIDELNGELVAAMQAIYSTDINLDQDTPDGQLLGIFAQSAVDVRELLVPVYNSFSPDNAFGVILDQRVALNGITRKPGTYTQLDIDVTTDRGVTLPGQDQTDLPPFTVADGNGNQFQLRTTAVIGGSGTTPLSFQAVLIGNVLTVVNTITTIVTVTLGVTAVNNPSGPTNQGEDEETDTALKIRRAQSFRLAATGPGDAILAALLNNEAITDAFVGENDEDSPVDDVPAHSVWCIVDGGADEDVAAAIYLKKGPGCGMKGDVEVVVNKANGQTATIKFDRPLSEDLWLQLTVTPRKAGVTFDTDIIKQQLVDNLKYKIAQPANSGDVVIAMLTLQPDGIVTDVAVSDNGSDWTSILPTSDFQHRFALATDRIDVTT